MRGGGGCSEDKLNPDVLLAGLLGALAVFGLGVLRDAVRRRRELRGMARLVHIEILHNHMTLESFHGQPGRVLSGVISTLRMETWESVRVRLAEMMPADDFGSVTFYYMLLQELKHMPVIVEGGSDRVALKLITNLLQEIPPQEADATKVTLAYANLRGLLGWLRMRRTIYEHRRSVSEVKDPHTHKPKSPAEAGGEPDRAEPRPSSEEAQEPREALGGPRSGTARGSWWRRMFDEGR